MKKLRLALNKGEELRFLSHLDYAQTVERMIRRAQIDMAYSEGFNPHMKISFSSALALGITATPEYMDMEIVEDSSVEDIMERLQTHAPKGLEILGGKEVPKDVKKMMAACNYAEYVVEGTVEGHPDWEVLLKPFNEAEEILYEKVTPKKTKVIDVKHFIRQNLRAEQEGNRVKIYMAIGIYPEGTIKPSEVWALGRDSYGWPLSRDYLIHRSAILIEKDGDLKSPLDV